MYGLAYSAPALFEGLDTNEKVVKSVFGGWLGGTAFLALAYPFYRGSAVYMGQTEHLRTTLSPTKYHRSQLKLGGVVNASFQVLGAGGGLRSLYYGISPLLLTFPIVAVAQSWNVQMIFDLERESSVSGKWKLWALMLANTVVADVLCAPMRALHFAMATTPATDWAERPSMRQILAKHPKLWRAGLVPFATAPATALLVFDVLPFGPTIGVDDLAPSYDLTNGELPGPMQILGSASLLVVIASQISFITGIRMVVDASRPAESKVPRYTSWIQATNLQMRSGWRTLCAGIISGAVLSIGLGLFSATSSTLAAALDTDDEGNLIFRDLASNSVPMDKE